MSNTQKTEIVVDDELVKHYAKVRNVSEDEARKRLKENMTKEADVDLRQQYQVLIQAFRKMSPQLAGVVQREIDYSTGIAQLKNEMRRLEKQFDELNSRLDFERENYKKAMALLNGIVEHDSQLMARITKLETSNMPFYKRILNRIKCLLNN
jgi:predicted  nucleic acid-binding Zn-ribbon protein